MRNYIPNQVATVFIHSSRKVLRAVTILPPAVRCEIYVRSRDHVDFEARGFGAIDVAGAAGVIVAGHDVDATRVPLTQRGEHVDRLPIAVERESLGNATK